MLSFIESRFLTGSPKQDPFNTKKLFGITKKTAEQLQDSFNQLQDSIIKTEKLMHEIHLKSPRPINGPLDPLTLKEMFQGCSFISNTGGDAHDIATSYNYLHESSQLGVLRYSEDLIFKCLIPVFEKCKNALNSEEYFKKRVISHLRYLADGDLRGLERKFAKDQVEYAQEQQSKALIQVRREQSEHRLKACILKRSLKSFLEGDFSILLPPMDKYCTDAYAQIRHSEVWSYDQLMAGREQLFSSCPNISFVEKSELLNSFIAIHSIGWENFVKSKLNQYRIDQCKRTYQPGNFGFIQDPLLKTTLIAAHTCAVKAPIAWFGYDPVDESYPEVKELRKVIQKNFPKQTHFVFQMAVKFALDTEEDDHYWNQLIEKFAKHHAPFSSAAEELQYYAASSTRDSESKSSRE
jgi:hypothetical protein